MDKTIEHQTTKATMKRRSTQHPLTRVDVWHLENVLFKLYRTIQSCVETVDSVSLGLCPPDGEELHINETCPERKYVFIWRRFRAGRLQILFYMIIFVIENCVMS